MIQGSLKPTHCQTFVFIQMKERDVELDSYQGREAEGTLGSDFAGEGRENGRMRQESHAKRVK